MIKILQDFEYKPQVGDRIITEITLQQHNGRLAWRAK